MIHDYLKAGYPALCVLTQEPHRAEQMLVCDGWRFVTWDCLTGIEETQTQKGIEEIRDPVILPARSSKAPPNLHTAPGTKGCSAGSVS